MIEILINKNNEKFNKIESIWFTSKILIHKINETLKKDIKTLKKILKDWKKIMVL